MKSASCPFFFNCFKINILHIEVFRGVTTLNKQKNVQLLGQKIKEKMNFHRASYLSLK